MRLPLRVTGRAALVVVSAASLVVTPAPAFAAGSETASPPTWSITPTPTSTVQASLAGVSCPTSSRCVAVGSDGRYALAETWSHNVWTVAPRPYVGSSASLNSVSCVSATHCVAVGTYFDGHNGQPLVETWNGTDWSRTPSPRAEIQGDLLSVSCPSAMRCVTVGETSDGPTTSGLGETWDGTHWSVMHVHDQPLGSHSLLTGVSCPTPTYCDAVGSVTLPNSITLRLIENWNGQRWAITPSPTHGSDFNPFLTAVSCSSVTSCFAVGGAAPGVTLVETWNGTRWSIMHSPNYTTRFYVSALAAVSCPSATSCVAVGTAAEYSSHSEILRTLVETWNGSTWAITPSPNSSGPQNVSSLDGVSCTTDHCATVGVGSGVYSQTLALSGVVPRRSVTVSWTNAENKRLKQMAAYLHLTPAATQKRAVYVTAYLNALGPSAPTPIKLPPMGAAATYTTVWAPNELAILDSVRVKFALGSIGATRASVNVLSYTLALEGH